MGAIALRLILLTEVIITLLLTPPGRQVIPRFSAHRGKYWTGIRAACEPMFHSQSLSSFAPMMNEAAATLASKCLDPAAIRHDDIDDEDSEAKDAAPAEIPPAGDAQEMISSPVFLLGVSRVCLQFECSSN